MVNLLADIIPGASAAGFALGQRYSEEELGHVSRWNASRGSLLETAASIEGWLRIDMAQITPYGSGGYMLQYRKDTVELKFSSTGTLYNISIFSGYLGKYAG